MLKNPSEICGSRIRIRIRRQLTSKVYRTFFAGHPRTNLPGHNPPPRENLPQTIPPDGLHAQCLGTDTHRRQCVGKYLTVDDACGRLDADLAWLTPHLSDCWLIEHRTTTSDHCWVTRVAHVTLRASCSQHCERHVWIMRHLVNIQTMWQKLCWYPTPQ